MKLQVDPVVDADRHDLLDFARPRAEGEAIQRMHRALLFARAGVRRLLFFPGEQLGNCAGDTQSQQNRCDSAEAKCHAGMTLLQYEPGKRKKLLTLRILAGRGSDGRTSTSEL